MDPLEALLDAKSKINAILDELINKQTTIGAGTATPLDSGGDTPPVGPGIP